MIVYDPLRKLMEKRGITKQQLVKTANMSWGTMSKINNNEYIGLEVLDKLCQVFQCQFSDLIDYIDGEDTTTETQKE